MKQPTKQTSEVLYLLMESKKTSLDLIKNGVINPSSQICILRKLGVDILCTNLEKMNKFKRKINYGLFTILNKKEARLIYSRIN